MFELTNRSESAADLSGQRCESLFGTSLEDLAWIDEWGRRVKAHVRVRPEDGVLIKMPTEVHPLNPAGIRMLSGVLEGRLIADVARECGAADHPERLADMHAFFCDVRELLRGRLGDGRGRRSVTRSTFTGSFTRLPVLSEVALTYRCNQACRFCYAGCGTPGASCGSPNQEHPPRNARLVENSTESDEMSTEQAKRVLDEIAGPGRVPSVSFTGGEATLRRDLPELVAYARQLGMRVNLITNGLACISPVYVARLVDAGLNSAQVSIEGPDAPTHEALVQRDGVFERAMQGVRNLCAADIHTHINTTLCAQNAPVAEGMMDLAHSLGLRRASMNMVIPTGTPGTPDHANVRLRYREIGDIVLRVRDRAAALGVEFHWYSPTPMCMFNPVAHGLGSKGCAACDGLLHVSPTGEVLPCSSFAHGVGNILEDGFEAVWFGRAAQYHKRKKHAPVWCRGCADFAVCQGACPLYWNNFGCGELRRARLNRAIGGATCLAGRGTKS